MAFLFKNIFKGRHKFLIIIIYYYKPITILTDGKTLYLTKAPEVAHTLHTFPPVPWGWIPEHLMSGIGSVFPRKKYLNKELISRKR